MMSASRLVAASAALLSQSSTLAPVPPMVKAVMPTPAELIAIPTVFFVLAAVSYCYRAHVRRTSRSLTLDDFWLTLSCVCGIGLWASIVAGVVYGIGRRTDQIPTTRLKSVARSVIVQDHFYAWGITFLKLGIVWQLLRLRGSRSRAWQFGLWFTMSGIIIVIVCFEVLFWLQTKPIDVLWTSAPSGRTKFLSDTSELIWGNVFTAWQLFSDLVFALIPPFLSLKKDQCIRQRSTLLTLTALGLLCSALTIPRFIYVNHIITDMPFYGQAATALWSSLELYVGIIAMSILAVYERYKPILAIHDATVTNDQFQSPCSRTVSGSSGASSRLRSLWGMPRRQMPPVAMGVPTRLGILPTPERSDSEVSEEVFKVGQPSSSRAAKGEDVRAPNSGEIV